MSALAQVKRFVWNRLPGALQHRIAATRYGYFPARRRAGAALSKFAGGFAIQIPGRPALRLPESMSDDLEFHFEQNGASIEEMYTVLEYARPGAILFDVGAHRGLLSLMFCAAGDSTNAVAYEPSAGLRADCHTIRSMNALEDRLRIESLALGAVEGMASGSLDDSGLAVFGSSSSGAATSFPMSTLDAECERLGLVPSVVKIDVEGYEGEVLEGARRLLSVHRPALIFELHAELLRCRGRTAATIVSQLEDAGYAFFDHAGNRLAGKRLSRSRGVTRFLCVPA